MFLSFTFIQLDRQYSQYVAGHVSTKWVGQKDKVSSNCRRSRVQCHLCKLCGNVNNASTTFM